MTSGSTEIVTIRPYLEDGSLAPEFEDDLVTQTGSYGCRPEGDFHSCGSWATDEAIPFCSVAGTRAWCPRFDSGFQLLTDIELTRSNYDGWPEQGPVPFRITLADGQTCTYGTLLGGGRTGYTARYGCADDDWLWMPEGGTVVDTTSGTWTAQKGPMMSGSLSTVEIAEVEIIE